MQELLQSGFENLRKGNLDVAIDYFNKAILLDGKNYQAYIGLGNAYLHKGDVYNAIAYFNKALLLDEKDSRVYYLLGLLYLSLNKKQSALEKYKILKNLDKDLADKLYEQIQPRYYLWPIRYIHNLYLQPPLPPTNENIKLYIHKDFSKYDRLSHKSPIKP